MNLTPDPSDIKALGFDYYPPHGGLAVIVNRTDDYKVVPASILGTATVLRPHDAIPIRVGPPEFDQGRLGRVAKFLSSAYHMTPEIRQVFATFGSSGDSKNLRWLMERNGDPYASPASPSSAPREPLVRDADGTANNRYNTGLATIMAAYLNLNDENVNHALEVCWGFMTGGFYHGGKHRGRQRPEKGTGYYGSQPWSPAGNPLWSKTHIETLIVFEHLTGHPFLTDLLSHAADTFVANLQWWDGNWGARAPSRWLDGLIALDCAGLAALSTGQALEIREHLLSLVDPILGVWVNNGRMENTSPWMILQLTRSLKRLEEIFFLTADPRVAEVEQRALGFSTGGRLWYRCAGPEASPKFGTTNAWKPDDQWEDSMPEIPQHHGIHLTGGYGSNILKSYAIWLHNALKDYTKFTRLNTW